MLTNTHQYSKIHTNTDTYRRIPTNTYNIYHYSPIHTKTDQYIPYIPYIPYIQYRSINTNTYQYIVMRTFIQMLANTGQYS